MPTLRDTQLGFARAVYANQLGEFAHAIRPGRFPAERHLQVYRNNVMLSLTEALKAVFPVVERLVSAGFFRYAADAFIRQHPPRSGNLHDFGAAFANFLGEFPAVNTLAYLPDVARLEWAWHEAFHAAEHAALDLAKLGAIAPQAYDGLRFRLHPSARLIASPYPILRIWQANQPDVHDGQAIDLDQGGDYLLVIRHATDVVLEPLTPGDYDLLARFDAGETLSQAAAEVMAAQPEFDIGAALRQHVARATVVDFAREPFNYANQERP